MDAVKMIARPYEGRRLRSSNPCASSRAINIEFSLSTRVYGTPHEVVCELRHEVEIGVRGKRPRGESRPSRVGGTNSLPGN
jgi:hypothetical protein